MTMNTNTITGTKIEINCHDTAIGDWMENIVGYGIYILNRSWNEEPIPIIVPGYNRIMIRGLAFPVAIQNPRKSFRALLYSVNDITRQDSAEYALPHPERADAIHQLFYRKEIIVYQESHREKTTVVKHRAWIYLPTSEASRMLSLASFADGEDEWVDKIRETGIGNIFPELLEPPGDVKPVTQSSLKGVRASSMVFDEAESLDVLLRKKRRKK